jgi:hypothetical protein
MITKKIAGILFGNGYKIYQTSTGIRYNIIELRKNKIKLQSAAIFKTIYFDQIGKDYHILAFDNSDLTKEITVKGENFVPIDIFAIGDDGVQSMEFDYGNIKLIGALKSIAKNNNGFDLYYLPHASVEELVKLNFVVNLPEGSWIPVTENNNPYK